MSRRRVEGKRAASGQLTAGNVNRPQRYRIGSTKSSQEAVTQAADVLLLWAVFPLGATARISFAALLERRLRRAYGRAER